MHIAQQMPLPLAISCSSNSRLVLPFLVLPFWYLLTRVVPDIFQKSSKTIVCVCVCVTQMFTVLHNRTYLRELIAPVAELCYCAVFSIKILMTMHEVMQYAVTLNVPTLVTCLLCEFCVNELLIQHFAVRHTSSCMC